jgi:hypothetical protein
MRELVPQEVKQFQRVGTLLIGADACVEGGIEGNLKVTAAPAFR